MPIRAFISYKRSADVLDQRVADFHKLLTGELGYIDAKPSVFLDTKNMAAGDVFPDELQGEVESADVLIVLLSPTWLTSPWCQKEFNLFTAKEKERGITPRLLPVLWVETPQLQYPEGDEIAAALSKVLHQNFEDLRHFTHNDSKYSLAVSNLAKRVQAVAGRTGSNEKDEQEAGSDLVGDLDHTYWWKMLEQRITDFLQGREQLCSALTDSLHTLGTLEPQVELPVEALVDALSTLDGEQLVDVLDSAFYALCNDAQAHTVKALGALAELLLPLVVDSTFDVTAIRQHHPCEDKPAIRVAAFGEVGVEVKMAMANKKPPSYKRTGGKLQSPHDMSPDVEIGLDELNQQQINDQFDVVKHHNIA